MTAQTWPSWRYGPNGAKKIAQSADDVPEGWTDSPGAPCPIILGIGALVASLAPVRDEITYADLGTLRGAYKTKFGKRPGPKWDAETIRQKLAEQS